MLPAPRGCAVSSQFLHALEFPGMRIAPDLHSQATSYSVVVLAQLQTVLLGHRHQLLATLVEQLTVGRRRDDF